MKTQELLYMARNFFRIVSGQDYFHQPQVLGGYFRDRRCYYNDFRGKANWRGTFHDRVPALYVPSWKKNMTCPVMVLQYGLGSMDRLFLEEDLHCLSNVQNVTSWILSSLNSQSYLNNYSSELDPVHFYFSNNSGMAQGEALSFLIRVHRHLQFARQGAFVEKLEDAINGIFKNMILPLEHQGTVLTRNGDTYFCETCRTDGYVILNGWVYSIFGLQDYYEWSDDSSARSYLEATLSTLKKKIPAFLLPNGWSYYDNKGRICSPFYQALHISLFEALHKLTGDREFERTYLALAKSYTIWHKGKYTMIKIVDKLSDSFVYTGG